MNYIEKTFIRVTFFRMLATELRRCRDNSIKKNCIGPIPKSFQIYVPSNLLAKWSDNGQSVKVPSANLMSVKNVLSLILRDDGWFKEWVHISPFAVTDTTFIVEVTYSEKWTNKIFVNSSFPVEPFQLRGPALPSGWRPGEEIPKVKLPKLRSV